MENSDKPKKKVPMFPKYKSYGAIKIYNPNQMISDSSDDSNIFENSSDNENEEQKNNSNKINLDINIDNEQNKVKNELPKNKTLNLVINKSNINSTLTPRISIDIFKDIEEYVSNNVYSNYVNKNNNNNNKNNKDNKNNKNNKNKNKEGKTPNKINEKKENKIINDFFINKEGDIELFENTQNDEKKNHKSRKNTYVMTKSLGPLMEEDENYKSIFINQNKSIFSSKKDLWKFQKILLENQIIDYKSKNYI